MASIVIGDVVETTLRGCVRRLLGSGEHYVVEFDNGESTMLKPSEFRVVHQKINPGDFVTWGDRTVEWEVLAVTGDVLTMKNDGCLYAQSRDQLRDLVVTRRKGE